MHRLDCLFRGFFLAWLLPLCCYSLLHKQLVSPGAEGAPCSAEFASKACAAPYVCQCLALNRGLRVCLHPDTIRVPSGARRFERQGLKCDSVLKGARPMPGPPLVPSNGHIVNPLTDASLSQWATNEGNGFYTQYLLVHAPGTTGNGIPVLAGPDVSAGRMYSAAKTVHHLLFEAAVSNDTFFELAHNSVRVLLAGGADRGDPAWELHPEVKQHFTTGLGGGAPWFPSTGIHSEEPANLLGEELFHTIQYVTASPAYVCMYHKAYAHAIANELYTTDMSGGEVNGEPVPTVQADEYLAMAFQRWFGSNDVLDEYTVPGNDEAHGAPTGREHLRRLDPRAFCLLAQIFRSDDEWNPEPGRKPWSTNPNRGLNRVETDAMCKPVLTKLASGCPSKDVTWEMGGGAPPRRIP